MSLQDRGELESGMPYRVIKRGGANIQEVGAIVYRFIGHDYGLAREDTRHSDKLHVTVTLWPMGDGPFFTIPLECLEKGWGETLGTCFHATSDHKRNMFCVDWKPSVPVLPSAEDLDALAEEERIKQATAGSTKEGTE